MDKEKLKDNLEDVSGKILKYLGKALFWVVNAIAMSFLFVCIDDGNYDGWFWLVFLTVGGFDLYKLIKWNT